MTKPRGILFDKDGTLFDFARTWEAWTHHFLHEITQTPEQAAAVGCAIGYHTATMTFDAESIAIAGTPAQMAEAMAVHLPQMTPEETLTRINESAQNAPQAQIIPLGPFMRKLRASGFILGVVTNDAEQSARAHLDRAGCLRVLDFVAGCDSGYGAKPEPGQLLAFAQHVGLAPRDVLMVGDSAHDLIAAARAGMPSAGVVTGLADAETLSKYTQIVLPDIGHLPDMLTVAASD